MKVCTDACLFGALVADCKTCLPAGGLSITNCLDIGTGTGLLPLILAQKNNSLKIDAVEIDALAAAQATENIAASHWAGNIQVFNEDIVSYNPQQAYDCIISNPPFFEDDLLSADENKNDAKHSTALNLIQLLNVVKRLLRNTGFFAVMLPYHRLDYFIEEAEKIGLYVSKQILVRQTMKHKFFRAILFLSYKQNQPEHIDIIIKDTENNYTPQFAAALKDYYLFL